MTATAFKKIYIPLFFLTFLFPAMVFAASKVAILPFQIHADKDFTFLQKGIQDMLSSRLALAGKVEVIEPDATRQAFDAIKGFSGDNLALMAGARLQADYVLHGSITVLGETVSIDAKMLDVTGKQEALSFFKQTQSMSAVIPQINLLATDINERVFNRRLQSAAADTSPAPLSRPQPLVSAPQSDVHMHPEKLIQDSQAVGAEGPSPFAAPRSSASSSLNPAFATPSGAAGQGPAFWKSRNFGYLICGVAVGDVNQDGLLETVIAAPKEIHVYQFNQGRMAKLATVKTDSYTYNIGIDIGDINNNNTPEIFISALNSSRNKMQSRVLEYDGRNYKQLVSTAGWYFRVIRHPGRGEILLGQGQLVGANADEDQIVELEWKGGEYLPGERVLPARRASLLGFALGDVMNDKNIAAAALNRFDRLRVLELNGKEVWQGADYFGGTPEHVLLTPSDPGMPPEKAYMAVRLVVTDLEKDGKNEVIAIRNDDMADRKLAQQRIFKNGQLTALQWNGLGLTTAWYTQKISGRIQDFAIADFDNDGNREIVCGVVSKEGALIGTDPKSTLIAYELAQ